MSAPAEPPLKPHTSPLLWTHWACRALCDKKSPSILTHFLKNMCMLTKILLGWLLCYDDGEDDGYTFTGDAPPSACHSARTHTHTLILVVIDLVIVWVYHIISLRILLSSVIQTSAVVFQWLPLLTWLVLWKSSKCKKHYSFLTSWSVGHTPVRSDRWVPALSWGACPTPSPPDQTLCAFLQWSKAAPWMPHFSGGSRWLAS